jgi:hypothetical protein
MDHRAAVRSTRCDAREGEDAVTVSGVEIASWLLQTTIAAGVATTAFFIMLPTKFGEKYLSFHFDRKLADLKEAQNQKIESLKEQLNHLGDRGKRSNEREYEALSDIWGQFVDAFDSTERCVTQFIEHPDFSRLTADEIDTFLNSTDFTEDQKQEFRSSSDKNTLYTRTIAWKNIAKAHNQIFEVRIALKKRGIFVPEDLRRIYGEAIEFCSKAEIHEFVRFRNPDSNLGSDMPLKFFEGKDAMLKRVMDATSARLLRTEPSK